MLTLADVALFIATFGGYVVLGAVGVGLAIRQIIHRMRG